jgi:mannose-6-phosphate isomerase-like protein (cupin superfamily)
MIYKTTIATCQAEKGNNTFAELLSKKEDNILRDTFIFFSPEKSITKCLTVGYTVVYPNCRTNGHSHADKEEVYFILTGHGKATVGEENFEIGAGDVFYIVPGLFHSVENNTNEPLTYFWAIAKLD